MGVSQPPRVFLPAPCVNTALPPAHSHPPLPLSGTPLPFLVPGPMSPEYCPEPERAVHWDPDHAPAKSEPFWGLGPLALQHPVVQGWKHRTPQWALGGDGKWSHSCFYPLVPKPVCCSIEIFDITDCVKHGIHPF